MQYIISVHLQSNYFKCVYRFRNLLKHHAILKVLIQTNLTKEIFIRLGVIVHNIRFSNHTSYWHDPKFGEVLYVWYTTKICFFDSLSIIFVSIVFAYCTVVANCLTSSNLCYYYTMGVNFIAETSACDVNPPYPILLYY